MLTSSTEKAINVDIKLRSFHQNTCEISRLPSLLLSFLDRREFSDNLEQDVGFEVITAVTMKGVTIWVIMPCSSERADVSGNTTHPS
jgi:hypothetical protein